MLSSTIAQSQLLVSYQRILNTIGIISRYKIIGKHCQLIVIVYYYFDLFDTSIQMKKSNLKLSSSDNSKISQLMSSIENKLDLLAKDDF